MCHCIPARQRFPRITRDQIADLEIRIAEVAQTIHQGPAIESHFLPRLLGQLKAPSLASLSQPQYKAACMFLDADLAEARKLVKHLKPALRAWEALRVPRRLDAWYVSKQIHEQARPGVTWEFDGKPFDRPATPDPYSSRKACCR